MILAVVNVIDRLGLIGSEIEDIRTKEKNCVRVRLRDKSQYECYGHILVIVELI